MISDPDAAKSILDSDFDELIIKCRAMLEKIMLSMSKPFLLQAAEKVCQNHGELSASHSASELPSNGPPSNDAKDRADGDKQPDGATEKSKSTTYTSGSQPIKMVDDIWRPATEWRKIGAGKVTGKTPWSAVEEELVYQGVLTHGVGNWALIHTDFVPHRTNVDIKDKWRTMKRQGRLEALAGKYGPLPATCIY